MACHAETVFDFITPVSSHQLNYLSDHLPEAFEKTPRCGDCRMDKHVL